MTDKSPNLELFMNCHQLQNSGPEANLERSQESILGSWIKEEDLQHSYTFKVSYLQSELLQVQLSVVSAKDAQEKVAEIVEFFTAQGYLSTTISVTMVAGLRWHVPFYAYQPNTGLASFITFCQNLDIPAIASMEYCGLMMWRLHFEGNFSKPSVNPPRFHLKPTRTYSHASKKHKDRFPEHKEYMDFSETLKAENAYWVSYLRSPKYLLER